MKRRKRGEPKSEAPPQFEYHLFDLSKDIGESGDLAAEMSLLGFFFGWTVAKLVNWVVAREERKSLNQVTIEILTRAVTADDEPDVKRRDLDDMLETWIDDPATDAALEEQRSIEPAAWE